MTKKMTKAASLYWKDIDVLEEARMDLLEFLEAVWVSWKVMLDDRWPGSESQALSAKFWRYKENQSGRRGAWHLGIEGARPGFEIILMDPRRTERDAESFHVVLLLNKSNMKKLNRMDDQVIDRILHLGRERGIELDFSHPAELWSDAVKIVPGSAEDTGLQLAESTIEVLEHIVCFDRAVEEP